MFNILVTTCDGEINMLILIELYSISVKDTEYGNFNTVLHSRCKPVLKLPVITEKRSKKIME